MIEAKLPPPSFTYRFVRKIRRILSLSLQKLTPNTPQSEVNFKNSAAWFPHGEISTRVVFYNYFWRNHHEEVVRLDLQLFDENGNELWRDTQVVLQDRVLIIDSKDIGKKINASSFEGYLTLSCNLKRVPAAIELIRFNVDYYSNCGGISTVHDQAIFWPVGTGNHSLGKMEVIDTPEFGTSFIFVNTLAYSDTPVDVSVEVKRHDGQSIFIGRYSIKSRAMRRIELWKDQPALGNFLEGKPGQLVAESNYYIKRATVLHHSKHQISDWFSVNHSEEYRGNYPYLDRVSKAQPATESNGPMSPVPFMHGYNNRNTDLVVFHDVPRAGQKQTYGINLYDAQGSLLYTNAAVLIVPLHGIGHISLRDYLPAEYSGYGLAQVYLSKSPHNQLWQESFPLDVHYIVGNAVWDAMYSQGSYKSINQSGDVKTRVFSRAYYGVKLRTQLMLVYPSTSLNILEMPDSATNVTLSDSSGDFTYTRTLILKPFQSMLVELDELFPEIKQLSNMEEKAYGVYVRDVKAKILVTHFTEDMTRESLATDHFYGG